MMKMMMGSLAALLTLLAVLQCNLSSVSVSAFHTPTSSVTVGTRRRCTKRQHGGLRLSSSTAAEVEGTRSGGYLDNEQVC